MKETIKVCSNCKHYMQHYMKHEFKLYPMNCGHCENRKNINGKLEVCELWKPQPRRLPAQRDAQIKRLTESIQLMLWHLENLALIAKDLTKK